MTVLSVINFGFRNWKYILLGIVFFSAGAYLSWQIQETKIYRLKAEVQRQKEHLKQCNTANESNQRTISALQSEIKKANRLCARRLRMKERTLKRLQEIEKIGIKEQPTGNRQEGYTQQPVASEVRDEDIVSNDPILLELNRMFK